MAMAAPGHRPDGRVRRGIVIVIGLALARGMVAGASAAGATTLPVPQLPAAADAELLQRLDERDAVIRELLLRVEELERRVAAADRNPGAQGPGSQDPASAGGAAVPALVPPALRGQPPRVVAAPRAVMRPPPQMAAGPPAVSPADSPAAPLPAGQPRGAARGWPEEDEDAAVERALERALVQAGALTLPRGAFEIAGSIGFMRRETVRPGDVVAGLRVAEERVETDALDAGLTLRLGLGWESQLELGLPYRHVHQRTVTRSAGAGIAEHSRSAHGFGDLRVSFTRQMVREQGLLPGLFAGVHWDTRTGETRNGMVLGSGFDEIGGSLVAVKRQDPLVFTGGVSYRHALRRRGVAPGDRYAVSFGTLLAVNPDTALRLSFDQAFSRPTRVGGVRVPGSRQRVGILGFGLSSVLGPRTLLDLSVGVGVTPDAPDYTVRLALPYRL